MACHSIFCMQVSITSADALSPILREMVLRPEGRKVEEASQQALQVLEVQEPRVLRWL